MAHTSIWVPGTIVQVEYAEGLANLTRSGWGTCFKQQAGFNWFHIPIATPLTLNGDHVGLDTVFVFYRTVDAAFIASVHLYDGGERIEAFDGIRLGGDHRRMTDASAGSNMWDLRQRTRITSGLGISVGVDFERGGEILFTGAGGHFQTTEEMVFPKRRAQ